MKVCLFCEGCYPYIPGGVSGWVQMLTSQFSDIEFSIVSIATSREEMSEYAYTLPPNVTSVQTLYLADHVFSGKGRKLHLNSQERQVLQSLFGREEFTNWQALLELISKYRSDLTDLVMSEEFYEAALLEYKEQKQEKPFFSYLWNCRSMYFPFLSVLSFDIPEADIYHSVSTGYAGIMGSAASFIKKRPFVLTEHGIYTREREEDIIRSNWVDSDFKENWIRFFKKLSLTAYGQAERVITLFGVNRSLQIELGCPAEKIEIIPNGVDTASFENLPCKNKLSHEGVMLGAVLRVVPIKDVKTMLLAFAWAQKQIPSLGLCIMGNQHEDESYFKDCRQMVETLDLKNVIFTGQVQIKEYLPEIDILLLSSISEGQPLSILEGLAAGIPYISTNVGDCGRLLCGDGENDLEQAGIIVPVMDSEAMGNAIIQLASAPDLRRNMGEAGRKRVNRFYQKADFLARYYQMYQELCAKGGS